jgi:transcriptional regulator NrdR family protein
VKHIVKRAGHTEPYDEKKLYASIFYACQSVREPSGSAELIAEKVVADVNEWIEKKHEVTSNDIRHNAAKHLQVYHPDASYMYLHHRVVW